MTYFWAIDKSNNLDYKLVWSELDIEQFKEQVNNYFKNKIAYNQYYINNSMCTIIAWLWILSNYFNYTFSKEEMLEIIELARKETPPFVDGKGWYVYKWVDLVRRYWNERNPDKQIITYRIDTFWEEFYKLMNKGYHIQTWFSVNREYWNDKKDNCAIDNSINWVDKGSIWHSIYLWIDNWKTYVIDSYKWAWCNQYSLELPIEELKTMFFNNSYVYIPKKNIMTQLEKDIDIIEKWYNKWWTKNYQNVENIKKWNYTQDVKTILLIERRIEAYKKDWE